jgi:hypothetical protein
MGLTALCAVKPKREWRREAPPFSFCSNSRYETDFGVSSAFGAGNTKIGFLKVRRWRTFKKPIFIMRIAALFGLILTNSLNQSYNSEFGIPKL